LNGRRGIYLIHQPSMPVSKSVVEIETWYETCANCECLLGDKKFTSEKEFDEHPDREPGYTNCDNQDEWLCPDCRDDNAIYCDDCGDKFPGDETTIVKGWDVCPWCVFVEREYIDNNQEEIMKVLDDDSLSEDDKAGAVSGLIRNYKLKKRDERKCRVLDEAKCYWCNARGCDTIQNGHPIHADCV